MLNKLRLNKSDKYQLIIATSYIAEMLVNFIRGREHSLDLGCEQGDIPTWDDLVIQNSQGVYEHIQVKRQTTSFSTRPIKPDISKSNADDYKKELKKQRSPLDKTMFGLAKWVKSNDKDAINKKRKFIIELPSGEVRIKNGHKIKNEETDKETTTHFVVRNFQDLCAQFNDDTEIHLLEKQKDECKNTNNMFSWLTNWCGFDDWEHIKKAMLLLELKDSGQENDINQRIEDKLNYCFQNKESVRKKIQGYIDENANYTSSIKPRALLQELKNDLHSDIATWTQYRNISSQKWSIIGTHDTRSFKTIEKPSQVVKNLWSTKGSSHLKIVATVPDSLDDPLPQSVVHLALHLPSSSTAFFYDLSAWKKEVRKSVYTLGCKEDDLGCNQLSWLENSDVLVSSDEYYLAKSREKVGQAKALTKKIYKLTWNKVCELLEKKNTELGDTALRNAVEDRWAEWQQYLDQNNIERNKLLEQMLHPVSEGEDIIGSLRVGLRTVNILADGFKMLLIVSVALNRDDDQWNSSIGILALEYWSGLAGKKRQVDYLGNMAGDILGRESASILLLSKVKYSPNEIYEDTIASNSASQYNLNEGHRPDLLVTDCFRFGMLIKDGNIDEIQQYLKKSRRLDKTSQEKSIQRAARV